MKEGEYKMELKERGCRIMHKRNKERKKLYVSSSLNRRKIKKFIFYYKLKGWTSILHDSGSPVDVGQVIAPCPDVNNAPSTNIKLPLHK
jgi:hypothetical protein